MATKKKEKGVDRYDTRAADLRAADATIGGKPEERLRWLVAWSREDPSRWHSAMRTAHGDALHVLVYGRELSRLPLAPQEVDEAHAAVRAFLRDLTTGPTGRNVDLPSDGGYRESIIRASDPGVRPAIYAPSGRGGQFITQLLRTVAGLLLSHGRDVIACRGCGTVFVAVHKQQYCEPKCNQRVRNARKSKKGGSQ